MTGFHSYDQEMAKMNRPFVSLRREITRSHANLLMDWLEDERVTCYLSDSSDVSRAISQIVDRTQLPILTHLFNQGGRFFMIYDRHDTPVGFLRMVKTGRECEIVLVIGDHANWGRKLGVGAIHEGLKLAFFDMRAEKAIAKIHPDNTRSLRAFQGCGFRPERETPTLEVLSMTSGRYLQVLRDSARGDSSDIYITDADRNRLISLIEDEYGTPVADLEHEIERAIVVEPHQVARDVVTMNSRVVLRLDDEEMEAALVYPQAADERAGKLSVLSEVGTAILGYREGGSVDWVVADRTRRIVIDKVTYQPEASGDFHL